MRFGPAGYPQGSKGPEDALNKVHELQLNALEMEYVRGVKTSREKAEAFGVMAQERDIRLTAHAPYFISLNSDKQETRERSLDWIMDTVRATHWMKGYSIAIHAGSYGKTKDKATENIISGISKCKEMMDDEGIKDVHIGLETMGKTAVWGTLREISEVMDNVENVYPVLDVCHIHARNQGSLRTVNDMKAMLDEFFPLAGDIPHFHISCIKYGEKGELSHLPLSAKEPDMELLAEAILEHYPNKDCNFVCESPLQEKDAVVLMDIFKRMSASK